MLAISHIGMDCMAQGNSRTHSAHCERGSLRNRDVHRGRQRLQLRQDVHHDLECEAEMDLPLLPELLHHCCHKLLGYPVAFLL